MRFSFSCRSHESNFGPEVDLIVESGGNAVSQIFSRRGPGPEVGKYGRLKTPRVAQLTQGRAGRLSKIEHYMSYCLFKEPIGLVL